MPVSRPRRHRDSSRGPEGPPPRAAVASWPLAVEQARQRQHVGEGQNGVERLGQHVRRHPRQRRIQRPDPCRPCRRAIAPRAPRDERHEQDGHGAEAGLCDLDRRHQRRPARRARHHRQEERIERCTAEAFRLAVCRLVRVVGEPVPFGKVPGEAQILELIVRERLVHPVQEREQHPHEERGCQRGGKRARQATLAAGPVHVTGGART